MHEPRSCKTPNLRRERNLMERLMDDMDKVDFSPSVNSSREEALLFLVKDNEAVIKIILEGEKFPEPTELLLIGCLIEFGTPRSTSNTVIPRINSQTI